MFKGWISAPRKRNHCNEQQQQQQQRLNLDFVFGSPQAGVGYTAENKTRKLYGLQSPRAHIWARRGTIVTIDVLKQINFIRCVDLLASLFRASSWKAWFVFGKRERVNGPKKAEIRTRKTKFLTVDEVYVAIFWSTIVFKGRTFVSSGFSTNITIIFHQHMQYPTAGNGGQDRKVVLRKDYASY